MLFLVLLIAWSMVLFYGIAPLIDLDALFESDMRWHAIAFVIYLPIFAPPIIVWVSDNR